MTMLNGFFGIGYIDGVYWTLFVEMKFYLLVAVLMFFKLIGKLEVSLWVWVVISGINFFLDEKIIKNILITDFAPFFAAGATLFLMKIDQDKIKIFRRIAFMFLCLILGAANESRVLVEKSAHYGQVYELWQLISVLTLIFIVFSFCTRVENIPESVSKLFTEIGRSAYPLYLIHLSISLFALNYFSPQGCYRITTAFILIISLPLLAYFISRYIESPLRDVLRKSLPA